MASSLRGSRGGYGGSGGDSSGRLDAGAGREVVYCHSCDNEWFREEYPGAIPGEGLRCQRCGSDATEIVDPLNDPRPGMVPRLNMFEPLASLFRLGAGGGGGGGDGGGGGGTGGDGSGSGSHGPQLHHHGDHDSDPEEADVEEFVTGPGGFFMHRTVHRSPSRSPNSGPHHHPSSEPETFLRHFTDMFVNDFASPRGPTSPPDPSGSSSTPGPFGGSSSAFEPYFQPRGRSDPSGQRRERPPSPSRPNPYPMPRHMNWADPTFPRVQTRMFRAGPMTASAATFTITGGRANDGPLSEFDVLLRRSLGHEFATPPGQRDYGGPTFASNLQDLLSTLLNPAAAVHGDAVYSQEALDRIITNLMEANPQSNAAPPASQAAIDGLERKTVDDEMLGSEGRAECTICIDELKRGIEVAVLPCKHWFHPECVTLWLKEHNTCPICRSPIETRERLNHGSNTHYRPVEMPDFYAYDPTAPTPASDEGLRNPPGDLPQTWPDAAFFRRLREENNRRRLHTHRQQTQSQNQTQTQTQNQAQAQNAAASSSNNNNNNSSSSSSSNNSNNPWAVRGTGTPSGGGGESSSSSSLHATGESNPTSSSSGGGAGDGSGHDSQYGNQSSHNNPFTSWIRNPFSRDRESRHGGDRDRRRSHREN